MKGNYSLARNGFIEKWDKEKYRANNKLWGRQERGGGERGASTVSDIQRISCGVQREKRFDIKAKLRA